MKWPFTFSRLISFTMDFQTSVPCRLKIVTATRSAIHA
jgi:hypothetical protein